MPEKIDIDTTLGNFVACYPRTRKVFDQFRMDYCCGGKRPIKEAATENNINISELTQKLEEAINESDEKTIEKIWKNEPLDKVVDHIMSKHHSYLQRELPHVEQLLEKVVMVHGPKYREFLYTLNDTFKELKADLEKHLEDEETLLFPNIKEIESVQKNEERKEKFNRIVEKLYTEHDTAGDALSRMRSITENYTLPKDACASFESLYENLQAVEDNLHEHVHLENTVLFPKLEAFLV